MVNVNFNVIINVECYLVYKIVNTYFG